MLGEISLYNATGGHIRVSLETWGEILAQARRNGWTPTGTRKPPVSLDIDREAGLTEPGTDGYYIPRGQMVSESDARALAEALEGCPGNGSQTPQGVVDGFAHRLCGFCHKGAFLICQEQAVPEAALQEPRGYLSIINNLRKLYRTPASAAAAQDSTFTAFAHR